MSNRETYPKFIIINDPNLGLCMIIGRCVFHRELSNNIEEVKSGGWWELNRETSEFTLFGSSDQFGEALFEDILACVKENKVFRNRGLCYNYEKPFTFRYRNDSGEIILIK